MVLFSRKRHNMIPQLQINGINITWSTEAKYPSVTIYHKLNFNAHVKYIVKKATCVQGILYPILNRNIPISASIKVQVLKMYIIPILKYASATWSPFISKTQWCQIKAVQTIDLRSISSILT